MRNNAPPYPGALIQNTSQILAASASLSAGTNYAVTNLFSKNLMVYFNVHSFPGSASTTIALKIRSIDPVNGGFTQIAQMPTTAARTATGMTILQIGPFMNSVSAAGFANAMTIIPRDLNFLVSLSFGATSKEVVFSLGLHWGI